MAKKSDEYTVLVGINIACSDDEPDGVRYEAGDTLLATEVLPATIKSLLEMKAIEVKDGDSQD